MREWAFDLESGVHIDRKRMDLLDLLVADLKQIELKTALDVGCGIGVFSQHLVDLGMSVVAFDARPENISEARRRHPRPQFHVYDIEDANVLELGSFDLVLCFGLLYHLENPCRAIRNLHNLTGKVLIIESMITPHKWPMAALVSEGVSESQSLRYVALVPSKAYLIDMLCRAGFPAVYEAVQLPDHEDFRPSLLHHQRRTILVASKIQLRSFLLKKIRAQPKTLNMWQKRLTLPPLLTRLARMGVRFLRMSTREKFWVLWTRLLPGIPLLVRLDYGALWLAWNDTLSRLIYLRSPFEKNEEKFVRSFLEPGMIVFDVGAHHGFYTLLASMKVTSTGLVVAFEPSPREVERLKWNLKLNRCRNSKIEQIAIGSSRQEANLHVCLGERTGFNSLRPPNVQEPTRQIRVQMTTLDNYVSENKIDHVDFLKVDTEGGDLDVLKGATSIMRSESAPIIMCEVQDIRTREWGYPAGDIVEFARACNYEPFSIIEDGRLRACTDKTEYDENLVFVPRTRTNALADKIEPA